jgi:hypothetical protein
MLAISQVDKARLLQSKVAEINAKSNQRHNAMTIAAVRGESAELVKLLTGH